MKIQKQSERWYYLWIKIQTVANLVGAPPNPDYFPPAKALKLMTKSIPNTFHGKEKQFV